MTPDLVWIFWSSSFVRNCTFVKNWKWQFDSCGINSILKLAPMPFLIYFFAVEMGYFCYFYCTYTFIILIFCLRKVSGIFNLSQTSLGKESFDYAFQWLLPVMVQRLLLATRWGSMSIADPCRRHQGRRWDFN